MEPSLAEIVLFAGNFAPRGWALCHGQLLPISQNTALFSLLGTIYGGDGRTTFALPDLRGRAPVSPGNGPGLSNYNIGQRTGVESVTLNSTHIPSHTHNMQASSNPPSKNTAEGASLASGDRITPLNNIYATGGGNVSMGSNTGDTGNGQAHNNMQPFIALNYIIALQGTYPSRN
ncbi:Microcystin-dependent protein [Spirosomataceae bacterium TFI 002]|nr:Microcystin-dependent protein [Spirosomataceae bacterium TFI 002]